MIYVAFFVLVGPLFLLLAGERIAARIQARKGQHQ